MTREFEVPAWEWMPQVPSPNFAEAVAEGLSLRRIARQEWTPQRPSKAFAFTTAAQIVHAACQETQQMRIGMRVVQTILGDDVYADLLTEQDAEKNQNRALLLHMFLRWAQHDARRVLGVAALLAPNDQAARRLALDTVEREAGGLAQRGKDTPWMAVDFVDNLEGRIRRRSRASSSEFRRFVRWTMQRTYGIVLTFVPTESRSRTVVSDAFLFFLERALGPQGNTRTVGQRQGSI